MRVEVTPLRGEGDPTPDRLEQRHSEQVLHRFDATAERGLGYAESLRRPREMTFLGRRVEGGQQWSQRLRSRLH